MKSFFLPIGHSAGASLPTLFSAMSCGATVSVTGLDTFLITDSAADPVLPHLISDLNRIHSLLLSPDNSSLFPSSFSFQSFRPVLPSLRILTEAPASAALIGALRGKGIPLSYKTDREAVEWAFSMLLSGDSSGIFSPFFTWISRIQDALTTGETVRLALLCDLCDPFSAGAAFAVVRYLHNTVALDPACISVFCLASREDTAADFRSDMLSGCLHALSDQNLIARPDRTGPACAGALWLLSLPSALVSSAESFRFIYTVLARRLAVVLSSEKVPAPGLHTVSFPGVVSLQSLGDQSKPFATFMYAAVWLLSDLIPAFSAYCSHPPALRSLTPNTRNGLFRRLLHGEMPSDSLREELPVVTRAFSAVLSEVLSVIRSMPDMLRLSEVSGPFWQQLVDACGRTITVSSEYDVSRAEAEEGGFLDIKPVHRVSMADTDEEKLERRLEDIAAQLKEEEKTRRTLFSSAGGCWSVLALQDCRARCLDALTRALEQQRILAVSPDADRLASAALDRRVRLLKAAVARCERDLAENDPSVFTASGSPLSPERLTPFSGQVLDRSAAEKLFSLLSASAENADSVRKELYTLLPGLLYGFTLPDGKTLFRQLLSCCESDNTAANPLSVLLLSVLNVSREQTGSLRFLSDSVLPPLPLLPDLYPSGPVLTLSALLPLLPVSSDRAADSVSQKRGVLALLLLRQYRRRASEEASLFLDRFTADDSPVLRAWLSSRGSECVWIASLGKEDNRLPFALLLPGSELLPARITAFHAALVPSFAAPWFDGENLCFRDPCALLGEGDRTLLSDILARMAEPSSALLADKIRSFLSRFCEDLENSREHTSLPEDLSLRLKSAFGLRLLPAFQQSLVRTVCFHEHFLVSDDIAARLLDRESFPPCSCVVPDEIVYLYRDVPFARENSHILLEAIPLPAEKWILSLLAQECRILSHASDDYHDILVRELTLLLNRYPDALPEARQVAMDLLEKAKQPVTDTDTELVWPWDPQSPSVRTILSESLGENLASFTVRPFSDMLTLFPARGREVIGDSLMSSMCLLNVSTSPSESENAPSVLPDAVLPPFSPEFCAALCRVPEGRTLFRPGLLSFDRITGGSIRVTLLLDGSFSVRLCRDYHEDEIIHLYSHDIPTLAVWPSLPFAPEDWHAYYLYAAIPDSLRISVYTADETVISPSWEKRAVICSSVFPLSFAFFREDKSAGALPNVLPSPVIDKTDPYTACLDFGSVGTSVVFSVGHNRRPMQGPTLVRTLINNPAVSRDLLRKEFLPAVPVSALLPTVSRIFRNVPGAAPLPFEDGIVLMSSDLQDVLSIPSGTLYTCLKWEEEKGRSVSLCLHQIMLMAALQARSDGAASLAWRFSLPDEMAKTGRERLTALFTALAEQVAGESGFAFPERIPPVTFAPESSALGAYFRFCAPEDTRGGFMSMDIGACTVDISLFLRGREQALLTSQIPLGVHYMLLPSLLRDPGLLRQDLGYIQDSSFRQDLSLLEQILRNAKADPSALRHSRLALDSFIADRFSLLLPALLQNPASGMPTRIGSVLLLHFSYLMMLAGLVLLQIAADPNKNDFLPEQMSLCFSGRGSLLPEYLPDAYKQALWRFTTMFRNHRVSSLAFLFSSEKKMEIPVGLSLLQEVYPDLPPASSVPSSISVRPEELLPQFLLRFAREFPASAELLFHGFFTGDFYHPFTPYGESVVSDAITHCFTEQTAPRPFDSLGAWIGSLLELIDSSAFS